LAGGAGRRVGGKDKGVLPWKGKPMVAHVVERLSPQVDQLFISCNRNSEVYQKFCTQTISDLRSDHEGPLAGLEAAAQYIHTPFLLVTSCDMPKLPRDLTLRLLSPHLQTDTPYFDISYANDGLQAQYLAAVMRTECLSSLTAFLDRGERAVRRWYRERSAISVDFSDCPEAFSNLNDIHQWKT